MTSPRRRPFSRAWTVAEESENIPSPCVRNCCLDEQDICLGCFRSLSEICGWSQADTPLRKQFLANANQRRQQSRPHAFKADIGLNERSKPDK
ncbi:DUF1289 domain-containing protein [Methylomonas sp. SURF-2]|uniref:DUF1289 domain-containing protein n=1 Tax=Methylomonas subterranea TaxID=2952225 RepID=A0ABT1TFQ7_9GAMM|nr:DUF1289 domain-containing protein [Methylomonas sp. SURF-2]MCQ8104293.1 DUF1289 domain-containing protein [Methylomonas sp. SURF-2]